MALLILGVLLGALAFGGLGWWADGYSVVPIVTAVIGASIGGALALTVLLVRNTPRTTTTRRPKPGSDQPRSGD